MYQQGLLKYVQNHLIPFQDASDIDFPFKNPSWWDSVFVFVQDCERAWRVSQLPNVFHLGVCETPEAAYLRHSFCYKIKQLLSGLW